jgi:hypothetical protein
VAADQVARAISGFDGAFKRLLAAADEQEALVALGEALEWLHSLEELHRERLNGKRYFAERSRTPEGKTTGALVYARGAMHHRVVNWSPLGEAHSDYYTDMYGVWCGSILHVNLTRRGRDVTLTSTLLLPESPCPIRSTTRIAS